MVKHIIDIPKEVNDKIKICKIKHNLKNVSDVIQFIVNGDPDDDCCSWQETYNQNKVLTKMD